MLGLVRQNLYSLRGSIAITAFIMFIAGIAVSALKSSLALTGYVMITLILCPVFLGTSTRAGASSKWAKMELVMPVRRKDIVRSKYLSYLILIAVGIPFCAMVVSLSMVISPELSLKAVISAMVTGLNICFITGAAYFPLIFIIGEDKGEAIIMLACLISAIISGGLFRLTRQMPNAMLIVLIVSIALFTLSNLIAEQIYVKKELS